MEQKKQITNIRELMDWISTVREYLLDACLSAQDTYTEWVNYFYGEIIKK
jgi:hypothetical protein